MKNLLKYEFRKSFSLKAVFLGITLIAELAYLICIAGKWGLPISICIFCLVAAAFSGITLIGINSILILEKDLNTKQSYMLFLTPNSSYKILGAKVIENCVSLALAGAFFAVLGISDVTVLLARFGELGEFAEFFQNIVANFTINGKPVSLDKTTFVLFLFTAIVNWLCFVTTAFLAIVLSSSVFSGKKVSGIISFVIFILISTLESFLTSKIINLFSLDYLVPDMIITLVFVVIIYFITAYIMDKKLSV